jgi:hypothetical protein
MARPARYRALLPRLHELRVHLLPAKLDPIPAYAPRQLDRILAYRLLAHAELEHCLEQLVSDAVTAAWNGYRNDHRPRTCLTALVAYYEGSSAAHRRLWRRNRSQRACSCISTNASIRLVTIIWAVWFVKQRANGKPTF